MKDYYAVLGVDRKAGATTIKNAYERKMKKVSKLPAARRAAEEQAIMEAYATLSNPIKREDLDAHLVEIDANLGGSASNTPLVVGIVVVVVTIGGVGYFLLERSKEHKAINAEKQRAAQEREKARDEGKPRR